MRGISRKALFGGTALALLSAAAPALAQQTPVAQGQQTNNGDIIVTAQKREQTLQNVPLSITAVTGEELAKRSASTIEDLQYAVPGLSITEFSPGQQRVQIRGISVYSGLPTVGSYLDETPLNLELNQSGQDVRLLDINRIEVLRGPQGTLYGQGAMGGTIRYITNDVDLERFSASADGEVDGVDGGGTDWKGEAVINAPLVTDRLGARFAGSYQHFGGWIDNPVIGDRNVNGGHALTLRGKLSMVLSDSLDVKLMVQHQDLAIGAQNLSDDNQQVFDRLPTPYTSKATIANATATYDLGFAKLLSATSYLRRHDSEVIDYTNVLGPYIPLFTGVPSSDVKSIGIFENTNYHVFTEEVRLSSSGDQRFGWTVGGFYRNSKTAVGERTVVVPDVLPAGFTLLGAGGTEPDNSRSWAAFGEASYRVLPTVTALVGLRYFEDRRVQDSFSTIFGTTAVDQGRGNFHALSPRFNIAWKPNSQVDLYANVAKGFRSGGFNNTAVGAGLGTVPPTYGPDSIWSYEIGGKFQSADRKISLELAGYRNVWTNVQVTTNIPGLPTSFITNGGKMSGWGADGSLSYTPIRALTFSLTAGWNNMAYQTTTVEHLAGDPADYVPRFTGSVSAEYRFHLAQMPSFVRVDYQHSDSFPVYLRNFQTTAAHSDDQNLVSARIGISGNRWDAALFVKNLLNHDSILYPAFGSLIYPARLQPRTIGVSFGVRY